MSLKDTFAKIVEEEKGSPLVERVTVPGIDEDVYVKRMDAYGRSSFDMAMMKYAEAKSQDEAIKHQRGLVLAVSLCDQHGKLLYETKDVEFLSSLPINIVEPIFVHSKELNLLTGAEVAKLRGE